MTIDGNWLLGGTVPFDSDEVAYLDAYTNDPQVYIDAQTNALLFYNNRILTDTTSERVTSKIPYLFLVGAANPYKDTHNLKLYGAELDDNNNLIITDKKLPERDFLLKRDSINKIRN